MPLRCLVRDRVGVRGRGRGRGRGAGTGTGTGTGTGRVRVPPRCLAIFDDHFARIAVTHLG